MNDVMLRDRAPAGEDVEQIRYAVAPCSLGCALVEASAGGLCAVFLGDDPAALRAELRRSFPAAAFSTPGPGFHAAWVAPVLRLIDEPAAGERVGLPVAIHGTPLQRRVWEALCEIPPGETRTYGEVAARLDLSGWEAPRRVAAACAANNLAVVIPCHRVIAADGGLSGYRWGVARKARLLARERNVGLEARPA